MDSLTPDVVLYGFGAASPEVCVCVEKVGDRKLAEVAREGVETLKVFGVLGGRRLRRTVSVRGMGLGEARG